MPRERDVKTDPNLSSEGQRVVAPNPGTFFWDLAAWLLDDVAAAQRSTGARPPYSSIYAKLARIDFALIILDGLEKVQDDGVRGGVFSAISLERFQVRQQRSDF